MVFEFNFISTELWCLVIQVQEMADASHFGEVPEGFC